MKLQTTASHQRSFFRKTDQIQRGVGSDHVNRIQQETMTMKRQHPLCVHSVLSEQLYLALTELAARTTGAEVRQYES